MNPFPHPRPYLNTILGIPTAKKRVKKELGITAAMKPFRWWTNFERRFKRKIGKNTLNREETYTWRFTS